MIDAHEFLSTMKQQHAGIFSCVPCSLLKPLINHVITDNTLQYISAVSEGEAVGIAVGSTLAGRIGVVMLQNSGLGNVVNPVTSLTNIYRLPCLLIVSLRGQPEKTDAIQHSIMGRITGKLLDLLELYHQDLPETANEIGPLVRWAFAHMRETGLPVALTVRKGLFAPFNPEFRLQAINLPSGRFHTSNDIAKPVLLRREAIGWIVNMVKEDDLIISTTGMISRELFTLGDRPTNFYMQGAMGTATALGLGVALNRPDRRLVVLDGDGSVLMRMGSFATVGHYHPRHFLHIILDNESHGTTGGQQTVSPTVQFSSVALAVGYRQAVTVYSREGLHEYFEKFLLSEGPSLLHIKILQDSSGDAGRPDLTPQEIRDRFMRSLNG